MLETIIALLTAALLGAPTAQSIEATTTIDREGDQVTVTNDVLVDGNVGSRGGTTLSCDGTVSEALCGATEDQSVLTVRISRTKESDGNWYVYDEVNVGDRALYSVGTKGIDCTGVIQAPLCTVLDTIDAIDG